jgi:hypothetical protein
MIQLKTDCLIFNTQDGVQVPCSAEWITLELLGEGAELIDSEVVHHASAAVLHYFKHELQRQTVSVGEFALALEKVLQSFGLSVYADCQTKEQVEEEAPRRVLETNLHDLASRASSEGFELLFFPNLRQEMKRQLNQAPHVLRFHGLRNCVKQLAGAERWNGRCQSLNDQIVDYLRSCWETEPARASCALMVV